MKNKFDEYYLKSPIYVQDYIRKRSYLTSLQLIMKTNDIPSSYLEEFEGLIRNTLVGLINTSELTEEISLNFIVSDNTAVKIAKELDDNIFQKVRDESYGSKQVNIKSTTAPVENKTRLREALLANTKSQNVITPHINNQGKLESSHDEVIAAPSKNIMYEYLHDKNLAPKSSVMPRTREELLATVKTDLKPVTIIDVVNSSKSEDIENTKSGATQTNTSNNTQFVDVVTTSLDKYELDPYRELI